MTIIWRIIIALAAAGLALGALAASGSHAAAMHYHGHHPGGVTAGADMHYHG